MYIFIFNKPPKSITEKELQDTATTIRLYIKHKLKEDSEVCPLDDGTIAFTCSNRDTVNDMYNDLLYDVGTLVRVDEEQFQ